MDILCSDSLPRGQTKRGKGISTNESLTGGIHYGGEEICTISPFQREMTSSSRGRSWGGKGTSFKCRASVSIGPVVQRGRRMDRSKGLLPCVFIRNDWAFVVVT